MDKLTVSNKMTEVTHPFPSVIVNSEEPEMIMSERSMRLRGCFDTPADLARNIFAPIGYMMCHVFPRKRFFYRIKKGPGKGRMR